VVKRLGTSLIDSTFSSKRASWGILGADLLLAVFWRNPPSSLPPPGIFRSGVPVQSVTAYIRHSPLRSPTPPYYPSS